MVSYKDFIRLIFVIFSLYLLGDAFSRWDGFRYHSTFPEFLPSVALVSILWSVVAILTAVFIWILARIFAWFCRLIGCAIDVEHLLLYSGIFTAFGVLVWKGKKHLWPFMHTSQQTKLILFVFGSLLSIFFTWLLRDKAKRWVAYILERITPLVWLFGMFVLISIPLVTYQMKFKDTDKKISQKINTISVSDKERPNIILVTFDALTARNMSVYGYSRTTTPFIAKWAKDATLFANLQAESNWTTPATASLMTGKRVWSHRASHINGAPPVKSSTESLPLTLKKAGYFNIAVVANPVASLKTLGITNSFDISPPLVEFTTPQSLLGGGVEAVGIIDKFLYRLFADKIRIHDWIVREDFIFGKILSKISRDISITTVPPEKVFGRFLDILNNKPPEPFFAWIHVLPPHVPYLPPEPYMQMFDSSSEMKTYKNQWKIFDGRGKYHKYEHFPPEIQPSIDILRNRYDEFIRYCDKQFEEFIDRLNERKKLNNTIVILSSDHGESFEHAYLAHGGPHFYEQVTHVPLIIKEPMQNERRIIHDLAEQIDISATILDFAGIPVPSWMEGRSLVPLIRGEELPPKSAFSMNLEANPRRGKHITSGVIAVWKGDYKLIHYLDEKRSLLFNLKEDPDELKNLYDNDPETGNRLLNLIHEKINEVNERVSDDNN